jgi:hypothetical protein
MPYVRWDGCKALAEKGCPGADRTFEHRRTAFPLPIVRQSILRVEAERARILIAEPGDASRGESICAGLRLWNK